MELDPLLLSRIQFAGTIALHIIFPSFTIGLAAWLVVLEALWMKTRRAVYLELSRFWLRIFALSFGMGVVSGLLMSFQFGTNWAGLSQVAGNILGPLMSYETTVAFMLEATFLGVLLLGRGRVSPGFYLASACLVALGTALSAFFIISANSWMHTPQGFAVADGKLIADDWGAIIFNPSFAPRFVHMMLACWLTTAFVIMGAGAMHMRRPGLREHARIMIRLPLCAAALLVPAQMLAGHWSGLVMGRYQPVKMAAVEARWHSEQPAGLVLLALPDTARERNDYVLAIPGIGSYVDTGIPDARLPGLRDFPPGDRPPMLIPFFGFRIMAGIGVLMLAVTLAGAWLMARGRLFDSRAFRACLIAMMPTGFIAIEAGWFMTETGRQPWVIYNVLRTRDAVSHISGEAVASSLALIGVVYAIVFSTGLWFIIRLMIRGPDTADPSVIGGPALRPLSAASGTP